MSPYFSPPILCCNVQKQRQSPKAVTLPCKPLKFWKHYTFENLFIIQPFWDYILFYNKEPTKPEGTFIFTVTSPTTGCKHSPSHFHLLPFCSGCSLTLSIAIFLQQTSGLKKMKVSIFHIVFPVRVASRMLVASWQLGSEGHHIPLSVSPHPPFQALFEEAQGNWEDIESLLLKLDFLRLTVVY